MWTLFNDMYSGGDNKEKPYEEIYIEAPEEEAKVIFYNRFNHNPERVTCTCCGEDYSIYEDETLEEASSFRRKTSIEEYKKLSHVLVIYKEDIKDEERTGFVPKQGYVWVN